MPLLVAPSCTLTEIASIKTFRVGRRNVRAFCEHRSTGPAGTPSPPRGSGVPAAPSPYQRWARWIRCGSVIFLYLYLGKSICFSFIDFTEEVILLANQESDIRDAVNRGDAAGALKAYTAYVERMQAAGQNPKPASSFGIK